MISVPEVKSISDIYIFDWVVEKIKVKLDRLHERADGVTGEILISHNDGHLYHGRLNLLSASSKTTLTNLLTKRVNSLDWQAVIEQVAMKSLQGFRTGEPLIDLKILPARTSPRYRLYPFILEGERQVFYGYGGQGKSKMAQIMATLVHCGVNMLDISVKQGNTLILDWESSAQTVREFINAFKFGMGIQSDNIPLYRFCTRSLIDDLDTIQKYILDNDVKLVIVDSVGIAIGGDAESQEMTTQFFRALRSLKISCVAIDHKAKKGKGIYGSVYKENLARSTFEFRGYQKPSSNILKVSIFHRKANDTAKIEPHGYSFNFEGDEDFINSVIVAQHDVDDIMEIDAGISQRQQIIDILKDGAILTKEIATAVDLPENQIRTILNRNKRIFVRTEEGKWGLLSSIEP